MEWPAGSLQPQGCLAEQPRLVRLVPLGRWLAGFRLAAWAKLPEQPGFLQPEQVQRASGCRLASPQRVSRRRVSLLPLLGRAQWAQRPELWAPVGTAQPQPGLAGQPVQSHLRSVAVSSPTHPAGSEELTDGQLLRLATGLPVRLSLKPVQILQEQELGSVRLEPVPARSVLEQPVPGLEPVLLEPVRSVLELERGQPVPDRQERAVGLELV